MADHRIVQLRLTGYIRLDLKFHTTPIQIHVQPDRDNTDTSEPGSQDHSKKEFAGDLAAHPET